MADITLTTQDRAELAVSAGDLYLPYRGAWTAHLTLADQPDSPPAGRVTLTYHGLSLEGAVLRAGESEGLTTVLVCGGRGGLWKVLEAKYYDHQLAVRLPLQELLSAAGERLSATSSPAVLSTTLPCWPRRKDRAGHLLDTLAESTGALWRVLPDGDVFFGADAFLPPADYLADRDYTLLSEDPTWLVQEIAPLGEIKVLPGHRFGLGQVGRVHYEDDGERFVARIWYLGENGTEDGVVAGLRALIREELGSLPYLACCGGQVVQQRGDGSLDVQMDDRRLPPLTSVPYLVPVPGAKLRVVPGSRCRVSFTGGDPRCPVAELYEPGQAQRPAARKDDPVEVDLYLLIAPVGDSGAPVVVGISPVQIPPVPPVTTVTKVTLTGKITAGSPDLSLP